METVESVGQEQGTENQERCVLESDNPTEQTRKEPSETRLGSDAIAGGRGGNNQIFETNNEVSLNGARVSEPENRGSEPASGN